MNDVARTPLASAAVLLAGASGGIGGALCHELDARGAVVTAVGRDVPELLTLPAEGGTLSADLRDADACAEAAGLTADRTGRIDVVLNAVGVAAFGSPTELTEEELRTVIDTNVLVPMLLARSAVPYMGAGGVVANLSGVLAEPGQTMLGMSAYSASKAAVRAFDQALARDLRRAKIRVLDVRPPHTDTALAQLPVAGTAPKLPAGLDPAWVARVICDAIESGATDVPSEAFSR